MPKEVEVILRYASTRIIVKKNSKFNLFKCTYNFILLSLSILSIRFKLSNKFHVKNMTNKEYSPEDFVFLYAKYLTSLQHAHKFYILKNCQRAIKI